MVFARQLLDRLPWHVTRDVADMIGRKHRWTFSRHGFSIM
jgi:hypothetical protein